MMIGKNTKLSSSAEVYIESAANPHLVMLESETKCNFMVDPGTTLEVRPEG
jgi:hypothetical protein